MASLYNFVQEILSEPSMEAAKIKVFGLNGININDLGYYENIISSFVRKKDIILSKVNNTINYNLSEDIQDMWDILFISQYIYKCWNEEQDLLKKELARLKSISNPTEEEKNKIKEINSNIALINDYFQKLNKRSELAKINIIGLNFQSTNNLEAEILQLKKAILVFQKLRDSFEHRNEALSVNSNIEINNEKNFFSVTIPSEYIDGFNKGRIIVKEEDRDLIEQTNNIANPLLEELNFDPKKIESFFYNVESEQLDYLLSLCKNDMRILYQLPTWVFYKRNNSILKYFLDNNDLTMHSLTQLKKVKYVAYDCDNKESKESIINILDYVKDGKNELSDDDYEILNLIGHQQIVNKDDIIKKISFLRENDIAILRMKDKFNFFGRHAKIDNISEFLKKYNNSNDAKNFIYQIINVCSYDINDLIKVYENYLKNHNSLIFNMSYDNETIDYKLNIVDFLVAKEITDARIMNSLSQIIYDENTDLEYIKKFIDIIINKYNTFTYLDSIILTSWVKDYKNITYNQIEEIIAFFHQSKFNNNVFNFDIKLIMKLINSGISTQVLDNNMIEKINSTREISNVLLSDGDYIEEMEMNSYLHGKYSINELIEKIKNNGDTAHQRFLILTQNIDYINQYKDIITNKNSAYNNDILRHIKKYISNVNLTTDDEQTEVMNLIHTRIQKINYLSTIYTVNGSINSDNQATIRNYTKYVLSFIDDMPDMSKIKSKIEKIESFDKLLDTKNVEAINFYFSNLSRVFTYDLISPENARNKKYYKAENVEYLLSKLGNDYRQLEKLPYEFFTCDINILEELYKTYNINICKSIFGIDNPKIVASLIYMNSVLGKIDNSFNFDTLTFEPVKFIHNSYNDTIRFTKTTTNNQIDMNQADYLNQIVIDGKTGQQRNADDMIQFIISKLRNSCAHFRFKPVKDQNGNLIEDKIYLYDENNNGINNFNIVMNLSDLTSIIREIELKFESDKKHLNSKENKSR